MAQVVCFTGPSGVGKTSMQKRLCDIEGYRHPVVVTTRRKRRDDGEHFFYVTKDQFEDMAERSMFVEHDTFTDYSYGTLFEDAFLDQKSKDTIVLDLTPKGVEQVLQRVKDAKVVVLLPDNEDWLLKRMRERGTQDEDEMQKRQNQLREYLDQLKKIRGQRIYIGYNPESWDLAFEEILEYVGVDKERLVDQRDSELRG